MTKELIDKFYEMAFVADSSDWSLGKLTTEFHKINPRLMQDMDSYIIHETLIDDQRRWCYMKRKVSK